MRTIFLIVSMLFAGCAGSSARHDLRDSLQCGMSREEVKVLVERNGVSSAISGDVVRFDTVDGAFELRFDANGKLVGGLVPSSTGARSEELCPSQTPLPSEMTNPQQ